MAGITNLQLPNTRLIYKDKIIYLCIKGNNAFLVPLAVNKVPRLAEVCLQCNKGRVISSAEFCIARSQVSHHVKNPSS